MPEVASGVLWGPDRRQSGNQGPEAEPRRAPPSQHRSVCITLTGEPGPGCVQEPREHRSPCTSQDWKGSARGTQSLSLRSRHKGTAGQSPQGLLQSPASAAPPKFSSHTQLRAQACLCLALRIDDPENVPPTEHNSGRSGMPPPDPLLESASAGAPSLSQALSSPARPVLRLL